MEPAQETRPTQYKDKLRVPTPAKTMSKASGEKLRQLMRKEKEESGKVARDRVRTNSRTGRSDSSRGPNIPGRWDALVREDDSVADNESEMENEVMETDGEGGEKEGPRGTGGERGAGGLVGGDPRTPAMRGGGGEGTARNPSQPEGRGGEGEGLKRKDRSPTLQEEGRNQRRRMNEFEMGEIFAKIEERMKSKAEEIVAKSPEGVKESLRESMGMLMGAMGEVMNSLSDGITEQRIGRETLELRMDDRMERLESKLKDVVDTADSLTELRIQSREKESIKAMEVKVEESLCALKVMNVDVGVMTDDKRDIVRRTLGTIRSYVKEDDKKWFDVICRRTRVVILGKGTRRWDRDGVTEYTVPTLLQCQDRRDVEALDDMLRGAGYHPAFHWPSEMMEFIWGVKDEVRKSGVSDRDYFFKVRPEKRDGSIQVKVEVKRKEGGRFILKGVWGCPPIHRFLWDGVQDLYKSKLQTRG